MQEQQIKKEQKLLETACFQDEVNEHSSDDDDNDYGSAQYWEKRYKKRTKQRFQWLQGYQTLQTIIQCCLTNKNTPKILNIGCGNSKIQDDLYEAGFTDITNNDISKIVIEQMQKIRIQKNYKQMKYQVMDVTAMSYPSQTFDLVLDKSTIDALLCSENPYMNTAKMLDQVQRVLKYDGTYLIISYGEPENRMQHLQRQHVSFNIEVRKLERQAQHGKLIHWAYICTKNTQKQEKSAEWKQNFYENLQLQQNEVYQ